MRSSTIAVLGYVVLLCAESMSANARIDAMGGVTNVGDISRLEFSPAEMWNHLDAAQVTFGGSNAVSPAYGVKEISDALSLGLSFDRDGVLHQDVYEVLREEINRIQQVSFGIDDIRNYPHLLLGVSAGVMRLGLDAFFEGATMSYNEDRLDADPQDTTHIEASGYLGNLGARVGLLFDLPSVDLHLVGAIGLPSVSGEYHRTYDAGPGWRETHERDDQECWSEQGVALDVAVEAAVEGGKVAPTLGGAFKLERVQAGYDYTYVKDTNVNHAAGLRHLRNWATGELYGGILTRPAGATLSLMLLGRIRRLSVEPETVVPPLSLSNVDYSATELDIVLRGGFEKVWSDFQRVRIVDGLAVRGGFSYALGGEWESGEGSGTQDDERESFTSSRSEPFGSEGLTGTAGIGVRKSIVVLDVAVDLASWEGVLDGPVGVKASLGIDMQGKSRSAKTDHDAAAPTSPYR